MVSALQQRMSATAFWTHRDTYERYELVEGHPIAMPPTKRTHGRIESRIVVLLDAHLDTLGYGEIVCAEVGYQLSEDTVRAVDVAVHLRPTEERESSGWETALPDLIVEVISPNDRWAAVEHKVEQYLAAGISELWLVNPEHQTVSLRTKDDAQLYRQDEPIVSTVLPKLSISASAIFRRRTASAQDAAE